ncbi:sigma-70 family RNA polymerase sigma factor [Streptococcus sp. E17BB]|uniref:sigma-70 family RNA polymerase sigma factor n=1 Tax=Streptococcus sp. E17BB TaxID=3278714 RepID=UPI00359D0A2B
MLTDVMFSNSYRIVRPIVLKLRNLYYIKLWELEDWEQEAMICLYTLLDKQPDLSDNQEKLRVYFKTKFSNLVNDELRKQESKKRQLNKLSYEDISEVAHLIPNPEILLDEFICFKDSLDRLKKLLTNEEWNLVQKLASGNAFKGKKNIITKVKKLIKQLEGE